MSGISPPGTKLDSDQVIRRVYDEPNNKLRVDAEVTAVIGVVEVIIDAASGDNIAIADPSGTNYLLPNPDGSINVNIGSIQLDASDDSVAIGDGTDLLAINPDGSINTVDAGANTKLTNITNLLSNPLTVDDPNSQAILTSIDTKLSGTLSVSDTASQDISNDILTQLTAGVTKVDDDETQAILNTIATTLSGNLNVALVDEPIKISGTSNGLPGGTEFTLVNNLRQQVLAAHDRVADFTYADFGTKNQRITMVEYTSATISPSTIKREFIYTLVGTNYRRDNEIWTIV